MPAGLQGVLIAAMLAALMSSLASVFNSSSTIFTMDFYKKFKPDASERELVTVGRLATVLMVVLGMAWIPFMGRISSQLWIYLQSVQAYISPPIAAVFLLGVFWRRINGQGALASLLNAPSWIRQRPPAAGNAPVEISLFASRDNPDRGGVLWVGGARQLGSLVMRAERRGRTPYRRFLAEAEPNLPAVLRNGTVQWLTVIAFHWALIVFAWSALGDAKRTSAVAEP